MGYELPEKFAEFGEARQNGFLKVKKVKEAGGRVAGIFCTFTPSQTSVPTPIFPTSSWGRPPVTARKRCTSCWAA